jgi:hypothetical protein
MEQLDIVIHSLAKLALLYMHICKKHRWRRRRRQRNEREREREKKLHITNALFYSTRHFHLTNRLNISLSLSLACSQLFHSLTFFRWLRESERERERKRHIGIYFTFYFFFTSFFRFYFGSLRATTRNQGLKNEK